MTSDAIEFRRLLAVPPNPSGRWATLSDDGRFELFQSLPRGEASELFLSLSAADQEALLGALPVSERRVWLRLLAPDDAADVIQLARGQKRDELLGLLAPRIRIEVEALLEYQADVAGGRMNPSYAWVRPEMTAAQAQAYVRLQAADRIAMVYYAYVLDREERLLGVASFRDLMTAPAARPVSEIMLRNPVCVAEDLDQEAVALMLAEHDLLAVPVVDAEGRMKGIVTVDDVIDVVQQEATEDIQKIGGSEALTLPYFRTRPAEMLRKRAGWLSLLFLSEMLTATAMAFFEHEIEAAVVLAVFVPLVISSGGNSGSQASTLVIRAMALGEVRLRDWWRVVRREVGFGFGLGAILATLGALRITIWQGLFGSYGDHAFELALTVSLSLVGVVAWGTIVGSMLPIALRRAGFDPANASAPFVATLCDVTGLVIYFTIAKLILLNSI